MENKKRIQFIDIARGISILLMITGHIIPGGIARNIIYSFHMPLFIIISGYFYKKRPFKEELKKDLIHLLLPITIVIFIVTFLLNLKTLNITNSILETLKTITVCWSHQSIITYNFFSTKELWFVYMLILTKLLFSINKKITKDNEWLLLLLIITETYLGYSIGTSKYWLPWSIDVSLACIIFYYLGYKIKKHNLLDKVLSNNKLLLILLILWMLGTSFCSIEIAVRNYPYGILSYITALCGSIVILKLSSIIEKHLKQSTKIISWCGKNSLYILSVHYIETALITYSFNIQNILIENVLIIIIKTIISISIAYIYIKLKEYITKNINLLKTREI